MRLAAERDLQPVRCDAASAMSSICWLSVDRHVGGFTTSRRAWATRVRPSAAMPPGVAYGSSTPRRAAPRPSLASSAVTSALTAASCDAAVGVDDHVDGVAGLGRELVLEQLLGLAWSPSPGAE